MQRTQHNDIAKVGHVCGMIDKINLQEWPDHLTKLLFKSLKFKPFIYLQESKIKDSSCCKAKSIAGFKIVSQTKPKSMAVRTETSGIQKDPSRRSPKSILPRIDGDLHGIKLRLVPILSYLTDDNMSSCLKKVSLNIDRLIGTSKHMGHIVLIMLTIHCMTV